MASLHDGDGDIQVVDVRNHGALPDLPDDAVVEVPARIDRDGRHPVPLAPLAPEMRGLVEHVKATRSWPSRRRSAATGGRAAGAAGQPARPGCRRRRLLEAILEVNGRYLPRFGPTPA